jgi:hypothetical protein
MDCFTIPPALRSAFCPVTCANLVRDYTRGCRSSTLQPRTATSLQIRTPTPPVPGGARSRPDAIASTVIRYRITQRGGKKMSPALQEYPTGAGL